MKLRESPKPKSVSWATPEWILEHYRPFFDPCPITGPDEVLLNGLAVDWPGFVFLNPPYGASRIGPWIRRSMEHGNVALLLPARTESNWFQTLADKAAMFWFPRGRIRFVSDRGLENRGANFPSVIVALGRTAEARTLSLAKARPGLLLRP